MNPSHFVLLHVHNISLQQGRNLEVPVVPTIGPLAQGALFGERWVGLAPCCHLELALAVDSLFGVVSKDRAAAATWGEEAFAFGVSGGTANQSYW